MKSYPWKVLKQWNKIHPIRKLPGRQLKPNAIQHIFCFLLDSAREVMHWQKRSRKGCDHKSIINLFIFFRWWLFLPPCRPLAWHKLRGTDVIWLGMKASERIQTARYLPFHKIHGDCPSSRVLLLSPKLLYDFSISFFEFYPFNIQKGVQLSSVMLQQEVVFSYSFPQNQGSF